MKDQSATPAVESHMPEGELTPPVKASGPRPYQRVLANLRGLTIPETVEAGGKLLLGLAGLCYVLGLLVVTMHLHSYGLNSLSLPQLHYVTAGVWVMVPPLVALVCLVLAFFVCSDLLHRRKAQSIPRKILSILTTLFGLALISGIILAKVGLTFGVELTWKSWVFIPALGAFGLFCFAYVILVFLTTEINRELAGGVLVFAVISILLTFYYVASFAAHTYQEIPWATGGGRPSQVELIVTPEQKPFLERAGFTFSGGQNKTDSLKLLLTTEKDYILISPSGNAVSIPGDSVKSVIYAK